MKKTLGALAVAAAVASVVSGCASSQASSSSRVHQPAATQLPSTPVPPPAASAAGPALPAVAPPPNVVAAEHGVQSALDAVNSAAVAVSNAGSQTAFAPAMAVLSHDLGVVQQQSNLAFSAGLGGRCGDSFAASRAADGALKPTRHDLAALARQVAAVHHAKSHYGTARTHALTALQNLYNAIAGHPLSTGPSAIVDELRSAIATDDRATSEAVAQAGAIMSAAQHSTDSAKQVAKNAALAACMVTA